MQTRADIEYYVRRERQERALAECASQVEGRSIHLQMASRYARMIEEAHGDARPTPRIRPPA